MDRYRPVLIWILACSFAWSLTACTSAGLPIALPAATPSPVPSATPVDYEAILARLEPATTLEEAIEQLASGLDAPAEAALVRVGLTGGVSRDGGCVPCAGPSVYYEEEVPIDQVSRPLVPDSQFWIIIQDTVAFFMFDGEQFYPVSVRKAMR